jgi:hypothetical protein
MITICDRYQINESDLMRRAIVEFVTHIQRNLNRKRSLTGPAPLSPLLWPGYATLKPHHQDSAIALDQVNSTFHRFSKIMLFASNDHIII